MLGGFNVKHLPPCCFFLFLNCASPIGSVRGTNLHEERGDHEDLDARDLIRQLRDLPAVDEEAVVVVHLDLHAFHVNRH
jgi:hypothetical protein